MHTNAEPTPDDRLPLSFPDFQRDNVESGAQGGADDGRGARIDSTLNGSMLTWMTIASELSVTLLPIALLYWLVRRYELST